VVIAGLSF